MVVAVERPVKKLVLGALKVGALVFNPGGALVYLGTLYKIPISGPS